MVSRPESAAATRRGLLTAAATLLNEGGPDAVTLREVGARAGVSRGAPYRHFADKESLVTAVATASWERVADALDAIHADHDRAAAAQMHAALMTLVSVGIEQPHLYRAMFSTPAGDPGAAVRAAGRAQDVFLDIVARVVGAADARRYGALLLTTAHGIAGMQASGHLSADKWQTTAVELVDTIVTLAAGSGSRLPDP